MEDAVHYYDRTIKSNRPLACDTMAREGHLWTISALVRLRGVFVYVC